MEIHLIRVILNLNPTITEKKKTVKTYTLNEPVTINKSSGSYTLTITEITETADRNALNNDQNYVELEYYDNVFNSKYDSKFKI